MARGKVVKSFPAITAGQVQLVELGLSATEAASRVGCTIANVSLWRRGLETPGIKWREPIQRALGIAASEWDRELPKGRMLSPPPPKLGRPRKGENKKPSKKKAKKRKPKPKSVSDENKDSPPFPEIPPPAKVPQEAKAIPAEDEEEPMDASAAGAWVPAYPERPELDAEESEQIRHMIECIRIDMTAPGLNMSNRTRLRAEEAKQLQVMLRLRREEEMREERYVRDHPAFDSLCKKILKALEPHPEASQAVLDALNP